MKNCPTGVAGQAEGTILLINAIRADVYVARAQVIDEEEDDVLVIINRKEMGGGRHNAKMRSSV